MSLSRNAALTFATQVISYVLIFVGSVVVARTTGVEGKGIYSIVVMVYNLAVPLAGFGIPVFAACFAGRGAYTVNQLFSNSLVWAILSTLWLGGAGLMLSLSGGE